MVKKITLKELNERIKKLEEERDTIKIGPVNVGEKYFESGHWETKSVLDWYDIEFYTLVGLFIAGINWLTSFIFLEDNPAYVFAFFVITTMLYLFCIIWIANKEFRIEKKIWVPDGYIQKGIIGPVEETRSFTV